MPDQKKPARDVFETALDTPEEYDAVDQDARDAQRRLAQSPEGQARLRDILPGTLAGLGAFLGQRGVRRLIRGGPKEFTGIGALTGLSSAGVGGAISQQIGIQSRRKKQK